jgi:hypothetical protein
MPLVKRPTEIDTLDRLSAVGGNPNDFGVTSPPFGFHAPTFSFNLQQTKNGWIARIQLTRKADPGTNSSYYLGPGTYGSGLMFDDQTGAFT